MAKAWRKHNMNLTNKIKLIEWKLVRWEFAHQKEQLQKQLKQLPDLRLRNKTERRMQYAAEVTQPSSLLYTLFAKVNLPVPPEFLNALHMSLQNGSTSQSS